MKKVVLLLLVILLTGCSAQVPHAETVPETIDITEPTVNWVEAVGMQWDAAGAIQEIPLTISDGLHYSAAMEYDGDLLLWSVDSHRENARFAELCLIELDDGSVIAQRDVAVSGYVSPRNIGDSLYLTDHEGGMIYQLDKSLQIVEQWRMQRTDGYYYVGTNGRAYFMSDDDHLLRCNLTTGEYTPVMTGNPYISWVSEFQDSLTIRYYHNDNGAASFAVLDLLTGEYFCDSQDILADNINRCGNVWLYEYYSDQHMYYLKSDGSEPVQFTASGMSFCLLEEGYIFGTAMDATSAHLYDLEGNHISSCIIFENGDGYIASDLIWNDQMDGFFFLVRSYDEFPRLLFWDTSMCQAGESLHFEPIQGKDENQLALEAKADKLEQKYGIIILVGEQCETYFDEFSATLNTDYRQVMDALDILDQAMSAYPQGFIRQLRYDYMRSIQIQLVSDLQADGGGRTGGGYGAFTQPMFDHHLVVVDIDDAGVETYYHEFSHIIDNYLLWDSEQREDALYSEDTWESLNPSWFTGYSYDYSQMHFLEDDTSFITDYGTISQTEDRAMVMEYAMASWGKWSFEEDTVLLRKLSYYARCIRDAFDTTGWTDTLLWEQFL